MKHQKYTIRTGPGHGEFKITDSYVKETFGMEYEIVWTGHNHFAKNINTGELFYIDKKRRSLIPKYLFYLR